MKMYNYPTFDSGIMVKGRKWYEHGSEPFLLKPLMYMRIAILITLQQINRHLWAINSFLIRIYFRIHIIICTPTNLPQKNQLFSIIFVLLIPRQRDADEESPLPCLGCPLRNHYLVIWNLEWAAGSMLD